jgi:hypothetical protein
VNGGSLVRLYPRPWRARYEAEFRAVLEAAPPSRRDLVDIARGALDAHLHPAEPSLLPGVAAVIGGGMWILATVPIAALPAPPDWPGYLLESLPAALVGVMCLTVAVAGAWLREDGAGGDVGRRLGRIGVLLAVLGHLAWAVSLAGTFAGLGYGAPIAIASTVAGLGTVLVGLALARAGDWPIAGLLVLAPVLLVIPAWLVPQGVTWIGFGISWVGVGLVELFGQPHTVGPVGWSS